MDNRLMTPEQLAAIRARADAATAGPWVGATDPSHFDADCVDSSEWSMYVERRCDRDFIAHARADIPALVAEVRRLRELCAECIESVEDWAVYASDYFKEKHGLDAEIEGYKARLNGESEGA